MTAESENGLHAAKKYAVQVDVAWAATAILFLILPPQPALAPQAFERVEWQTELDHCSGSVSTV